MEGAQRQEGVSSCTRVAATTAAIFRGQTVITFLLRVAAGNDITTNPLFSDHSRGDSMNIRYFIDRQIIKTISFLKGVLLLIRPHLLLGWMKKPTLKISNTLSLSQWASKQKVHCILNDFFTAQRDYSKRYKLYKAVSDELNLKNEAIHFIEFGVSGGHSFRWWLHENTHEQSRFIGFDTFEGLPENWGTFNKGDMAAELPDFKDKRSEMVKGLFQNTLNKYFQDNPPDPARRKIIHLDADLFSSTLCALAAVSHSLNKGDILFFDEFNVPDHEFYAFRLFTESWYVKTRLLGAVNNYLQTAFIIE